MTTFKVGDKIRVTAGGSCYRGMTGVVTEVVKQYGETTVHVRLAGHGPAFFNTSGLTKI